MERWGREPVREVLRATLREERERLGDAGERAVPGDAVLATAHDRLEAERSRSLRRVLNGTGVVLHTNLGRAPLSTEALSAVVETGRGYASLEVDLASGRRGDRQAHCESRIASLTGSEAALVVNNAAAALVLVVHGLARGRRVVVSRGELVEIGGSFRLPEMITAAGGVLAEVGTTNRTCLEDYARAIQESDAGLLLKVHPSNFRIEGFTRETALGDLVRLGARCGVPVVHDLGSGLLLADLVPGLPPEPTPASSVRAGADLILWSGDKLLGGPQAGILHGRREPIEILRRASLLRALRPGRTILAALEATLELYERPDRAADEIPALRMLRASPAAIERRARGAHARLPERSRDRVGVVALTSLVGGGACPGTELPSAGWRVEGPAAELEARCRSACPPLLGRVDGGDFVLDFRTLEDEDAVEAAEVLGHVLEPEASGEKGAASGPVA
jgi:L-seryl-tRNA(Ser) seleniumtransferase